MNSDDRHVLDMLQEALGPEHAEESITHYSHAALTALISAMCWQDNNPNRAEYITRLGELHRDDDEPVIAAIVTVAGWLREAR